MSVRVAKFVILFSAVLQAVRAQDCRSYGQSCGDHDSCCGGCCLHGTCIDTYRDCNAVEHDPCLDFDCPPGEVCVVFHPVCRGCESTRECRYPGDVSSAFPDILSPNLHFHSAATTSQLSLMHILYFLPMLILK